MTTSICKVCQKVSTSQCARCRQVTYCSRECQKANWKTHKVQCVPPQMDIEDLFVERAVATLREHSKECHCAQCASLCSNIPGAYDPQHCLETCF